MYEIENVLSAHRSTLSDTSPSGGGGQIYRLKELFRIDINNRLSPIRQYGNIRLHKHLIFSAYGGSNEVPQILYIQDIRTKQTIKEIPYAYVIATSENYYLLVSSPSQSTSGENPKIVLCSVETNNSIWEKEIEPGNNYNILAASIDESKNRVVCLAGQITVDDNNASAKIFRFSLTDGAKEEQWKSVGYSNRVTHVMRGVPLLSTNAIIAPKLNDVVGILDIDRFIQNGVPTFQTSIGTRSMIDDIVFDGEHHVYVFWKANFFARVAISNLSAIASTSINDTQVINNQRQFLTNFTDRLQRDGEFLIVTGLSFGEDANATSNIHNGYFARPKFGNLEFSKSKNGFVAIPTSKTRFQSGHSSSNEIASITIIDTNTQEADTNCLYISNKIKELNTARTRMDLRFAHWHGERHYSYHYNDKYFVVQDEEDKCIHVYKTPF